MLDDKWLLLATYCNLYILNSFMLLSLHKCTVKVKSQFYDVNQVIAKVKAATCENKTRQAKFFAIGYPPPSFVI